MEEYFKKSILDELYEAKTDDFREKVLKEMSRRSKDIKSMEIGERLINKIKDSITDDRVWKETLKIINQYELEKGKEEDFWNKMYYKLGVYDSKEMKEITNNQVKKTRSEENTTFFENYSDDFYDYLNVNRIKMLKENIKYKKLANEVKKLKKDNPNVRSFIEDKEIVSLSNTELKFILKILKIQEEMDDIEQKEIFKLGVKETLFF